MGKWRQYVRLYELIAFSIGFALMAYELTASRLLAPAVGSSVYVWTSVIGVIVAALSIGYALGGAIADMRVAKQDLAWLLLAGSFAVSYTLIMSPGILQLLAWTRWDVRLQGLLGSLALFAPASLIAGMISPYLVRLRTVSLATTGKSVASLSALNAIGGISGTFCVGFICFSYIGTRETLAILSCLLIAGSWLVMPRHHWKIRLGCTFVGGILLLIGLLPSLPKYILADLDTPTSHYQVLNATHDGRQARILVMGALTTQQSGIYTQAPDELVFGYTRQIAQLTARAPSKQRMLILGGGAFTLPGYFAAQYPHMDIDVVEIDPQLVTIATRYFNYHPRPNTHIYAEDARTYVNTTSKHYDIVVVDVYADYQLPFALTTSEFTTKLSRVVNPQGVVLVNVISANNTGCHQLLAGFNGSYRQAFSSARAFPVEDQTLQKLQNIIIAYSNRPLDWIGDRGVELPIAPAFRDNFAPVELLQQQCRGNRA